MTLHAFTEQNFVFQSQLKFLAFDQFLVNFLTSRGSLSGIRLCIAHQINCLRPIHPKIVTNNLLVWDFRQWKATAGS